MTRTHPPHCAVLLLLAMMGLSACHHEMLPDKTAPVHSDVSYQPVPDKSLGHYELTGDQGVTGADMAAANPVPIYPSTMIATQQKDVEIQALLIVGRDGHVHDVRIAGRQASGEAAPFALAVATATLAWKFTPLRITNWKTMPDGSSKRIDGVAKPFSQRYQFHFTIVDGKPKVISATGAPGNTKDSRPQGPHTGGGR